MSVDGPNKNLNRTIPFQEIHKSKQISDTASVMTRHISANPTDMIGLEVMQDNKNTKFEYNEDGTVKYKMIYDNNGNLMTVYAYDNLGNVTTEADYTGDVIRSVSYDKSGCKSESFMDKSSLGCLSVVNYDDKDRIVSEIVYNQETGNPQRETSFNPETGKKILELEYNPEIEQQVLKRHEIDERYPEKHYEFAYDEDNNFARSDLYDSKMKLRKTIVQTDNPIVREAMVYNDEGNVISRNEIIMGQEINPVATALSKDFSDENIKKIDCDNVVDVFNDYQFRNKQLEAAKEFSREQLDMLRDVQGTDMKSVDVKKRFEDGLLDKIFENQNKSERSAQIRHIADAFKQRFENVKNDNAVLYCNNPDAVNKGIQYISTRLNLTPNMKLSEVKKTFEVAVSMLENHDYFVDAANGEIDKINYQGKTGDCWLLGAVNSIAETENGQKFLKDHISVDEASGDITVTLYDPDKGQKQGRMDFVITQDDLLTSGSLSQGDADLRAIEIAFKKMFAEKVPPRTLEGGQAYEALEYLTGKEVSIASVKDELSDPAVIQNLKQCPLIVYGGDELFPILENLQPNVAICASARLSEVETHQYWLKIDGENIIAKDPHNSVNEKVYTREEFWEKFNGGFHIMIL